MKVEANTRLHRFVFGLSDNVEAALGSVHAVFIQTDSIFCQKIPARPSCLILLSAFSATVTGNILTLGSSPSIRGAQQ